MNSAHWCFSPVSEQKCPKNRVFCSSARKTLLTRTDKMISEKVFRSVEIKRHAVPASHSFPSHLVQTDARDVLKWGWRRLAEAGRITGVCRQTADREGNWVAERPPRGRSGTSRQMHRQLFAYSKRSWARPKTKQGKTGREGEKEEPPLRLRWITAWASEPPVHPLDAHYSHVLIWCISKT